MLLGPFTSVSKVVRGLDMSGHRAAHDLAKSPLSIVDPGAGGTIVIDRFGGICEMVSAGAEARTLADPTAAGIQATVRMRTDGGDITLTAANGLNVAGNTVATYDAVGEQLHMTSVETATAGTFRWEVLVNTGSVGLA